ncbi:S-protein homolog 1-like [Neltuma alba]|uniref:S-protein homolog 1-like n=1 Tax=Neltuma alba TaxID=207710 RepID=UPI0010A36F8E|nr:S-protein homolog 1-like [Prosopis alba]
MAKIRANSQSIIINLVAVVTLVRAPGAIAMASDGSNALPVKDNIFPEFIKWHVYIVNGLSNNQNLFTRCKSQEDDLGTHNLSGGSNLTWSFRTEFFHSTLFWCHLRTDTGVSAEFEVFWYDDRLFRKCQWKNCIWVAKDQGIYLTDLSQNRDELRYTWEGH